MSATFFLLLMQVARGHCSFKASTAEKEKQMWKRKKTLTSLHTKVQILQNITSGLENTVDTVVAHGISCTFRRYMLLLWLTRQGRDSSVMVRPQQTHNSQLCTDLSLPHLSKYLGSTQGLSQNQMLERAG